MLNVCDDVLCRVGEPDKASLGCVWMRVSRGCGQRKLLGSYCRCRCGWVGV